MTTTTLPSPSRFDDDDPGDGEGWMPCPSTDAIAGHVAPFPNYDDHGPGALFVRLAVADMVRAFVARAVDAEREASR